MFEEIKTFVLTYWKWILLVIFILIIILITKKRKYFWKDKQGNKIGFKEFMKRWKDGLSGVTPLQQCKMQVLGTWITLAGILAGIVINILVRMENQWPWILTVLIGSLIITGISQVGALQKLWILRKVEEQMKLLNSPVKSEGDGIALQSPSPSGDYLIMVDGERIGMSKMAYNSKDALELIKNAKEGEKK